MLFRKGYIFSLLSVIIMAAFSLYSCSPVDLDFNPSPAPGRTEEDFDRNPVKEYKNVFILYSMGFNDIMTYLADDIREVLGSQLMTSRRDVILIFSQIAENRKAWYNYPVSPTLTKISRNAQGKIQKDTLLVMDKNAVAASKEVLHEVLTYVKENFDAQTYGILFSSHASGWVPQGYLSNPDNFEEEPEPNGQLPRMYAPTYHLRREGDLPVKSIGVHYHSLNHAQEMEITDMAAAFPFKFDYAIFDACFMGGVEVAYELRNVVDKVMFSQTEILADGMDYESMASYMFAEGGPDLEGFCQRFYDHYNKQSSLLYRSATISLVDCNRLESLAQATQTLLDRYRNGLDNLIITRDVQKYYRSSNANTQCWFYDFGDIIEKCGLSDEDRTLFNEKLDDAILYKAATPWFMSDFKVVRHSGLSMYLPYKVDRDYLNNFYKGLEWNKTVGLIQ